MHPVNFQSTLFLFLAFLIANQTAVAQTKPNPLPKRDTIIKSSAIKKASGKTKTSKVDGIRVKSLKDIVSTVALKKNSPDSLSSGNDSIKKPVRQHRQQQGNHNTPRKRPNPTPHLTGLKHGEGSRVPDGKKHNTDGEKHEMPPPKFKGESK